MLEIGCTYAIQTMCNLQFNAGFSVCSYVSMAVHIIMSIITSTPSACTSSQFQCANGACVSQSSRCTGISGPGGCTDGSDQTGCRKLLLLTYLYYSVAVY